MQDHLKGTTAVSSRVVGVPGSEPDNTSPASPVAVSSNLPPNIPGDDPTISPPIGPPNSGGDADYWNALINEKTAADYLGMTGRWMQAKRQHGGGPIFVRISQRCIRYRRIDLKEYADRQLRLSTSDSGESAAA